MESLGTGESRVRAVRVDDELWGRLEHWARASGLGDSEALRKLLKIGLKTKPEIVLRDPLAWMPKKDLPPGEWVFVRITPGDNWWDLDDVVGRLPGAKRVTSRLRVTQWWQVPVGQVGNIRMLFASLAVRVRLHRSE